MKTVKIINSALAPIFVALSALPANAALVETDDTNFGSSSVVIDTLTGLNWLKPIETTNQSYLSIKSQLGTGIYSGFRYATRTEVETLFTDAGMPLACCYDGINYGQVFDPIVSFVNLFGMTYSGGTGLLNDVAYGVSGLLAPAASGSNILYGNAQYSIIVNRFPGYTNGTGFGEIADTYEAPTSGSWLVRDGSDPPVSVPEPATLALMLVGLAGCVRRFRKTSPTD